MEIVKICGINLDYNELFGEIIIFEKNIYKFIVKSINYRYEI